MEVLEGSDVDLFDAVPFPFLDDDLSFKYSDSPISDVDENNVSKSSSFENLFSGVYSVKFLL